MSNQATTTKSVVSKIVAFPAWILDEFKAREIDAEKVLCSVNAARSRAQLDGNKFKAGNHKMNAKEGIASFTESETRTYISDELGVQFQSWIDAMAKMHKQFGFYETTAFPVKFVNWLNKHKFAKEQEQAEEQVKEQEPVNA